MSHLATLISDLALILGCAGLMTLIFKKLKQPLVLGYVVAGFLASPHMPYTPSVIDTANIQTWADIGVIFLLFALGLDFSLKKIAKVGGAAIIAARGASSAASAANAAIDTIQSLITPTPAGDWFSVAVCSDGSYGTPIGTITSLPIRSNGTNWEVVQGVSLSDYAKEKIAVSNQELLDEQKMVREILG